MTTDIYNSCKASLIKYAKDVAVNAGFSGFQPTDFDAHASVDAWPEGDLIGLAEYSISNQQEIYDVTAMIAISSATDDSQMARMTPVVGLLFNDLQVGKIIDIVDYVTGTKVGNFKVKTDVQVLPAARTKTRPLIMVAVNLSAVFPQQPS